MTEELGERDRRILELLAERGSVSVAALAAELGVSEVTVRSDFKSLEDRGFITRTRGGASPAFHPSILDRQRSMVEEKNRIARAAADLVHDGDAVMIEAGTTTALIAKYLLGKRDIHIVTNSTLVYSYARLNPALSITMTGGEFRRATESMVGPVALRAIEDFNVSIAFVGTDGFSLEKGLTTQLVEGAEIVKAMRARARQTWLVADSSKYGKSGFVGVLLLSAISGIITDSGLSDMVVRSLEESSIKVRRF